MDAELLVRLAREAGFDITPKEFESGVVVTNPHQAWDSEHEDMSTELQRFAVLVAECCAQECDQRSHEALYEYEGESHGPAQCASLIREKFKEPT